MCGHCSLVYMFFSIRQLFITNQMRGGKKSLQYPCFANNMPKHVPVV